MKKRYGAELIICIIGEIDNTSSASRPTFPLEEERRGMNVNETTRLNALDEENSRLKRVVADLSLDSQILNEVNSKSG